MADIQQSFPWLQSSWAQLTSYIKQNRIPQALLIIGNKGLGKQQLAESYSQALMCSALNVDGQSCGQCQSCTLFNADTHPDYVFITPDEPGKSIGVDVIRQLTAKLALKPQFDKYRVVVINPADSLTNASANAFLKYLEEPTERTCLVLISEKPSKLPATIRSRCQKLFVSVSDENSIKTWLSGQGVTGNIDLLLKMSQGSPLFAQQLADNTTLDFRLACFKQWSKLAGAKANFLVIAEQWSKLDNQTMDLVFSWLISWVMDMIKLNHHKGAIAIVNIDLQSNLQEMAGKLDLKKLYQYYDFLLVSKKRLDTQLNKQLMLEEILIQWSDINNG